MAGWRPLRRVMGYAGLILESTWKWSRKTLSKVFVPRTRRLGKRTFERKRG